MLKCDDRPDLAAFALAIDSDREMGRSELVPMAPNYKHVTEYLTIAHEKQTKSHNSIREKQRLNKTLTIQ